MPERVTIKSVILEYLTQHVGEWVSNPDLREAMYKKGIKSKDDVPRTIRALIQEGWQIEVRGDGYNRLTSLQKGEPKGIRVSINEKQRYAVFARDNFRCRACGRSVGDGVKLQVDHIIPVEWGGKSELDNYQTLCEECNRGKKAWTDAAPGKAMRNILEKPTIEARIEALFDALPNQDIPSTMIQLVARGIDWQRAIRKIRERTGKRILPTQKKRAYRYYKE